MKFENGLRGDIKMMVVPLSITYFRALIEKCKSDWEVTHNPNNNRLDYENSWTKSFHL